MELNERMVLLDAEDRAAILVALARDFIASGRPEPRRQIIRTMQKMERA